MIFPYAPDFVPLRSGIAVLLACGALAACSSPGDNATNASEGNVFSITEVTVPGETDTPPAPQEPDNGAGPTIGGDGSEILLSPLTVADIESVTLDGELACSFGASAGGAPLLLAKGNAGSKEPAAGVVKTGDHVETVGAPGGFDAIVRGATFSGKGKTIRIARTGEAAVGGGESPLMPATLTYDRADGARRVFDGLWTCGP